MMDLLQLRRMPKVDLHVHLDGCVLPQTLSDLGRQLGLALPAADSYGLLPYMQVDEHCAGLKDYLNKFDFVLPFLQSGEALQRVAEEAVVQAASHHTYYLEVRFAPQLHRVRGMTAEETIHHVLKGLRSGEKKTGIRARAIAICMRHHALHANLEVIHAAASFLGSGLVAVDLAGDEASYPAVMFREVFALAQAYNLPVTIHAGEAAGPENIEEAVTRLGAARIGHGVRLKDNPRVLRMIRERQIPLELCPTSNIQTKAVSGWEAYPVREYFEQGILFTVNTDNPGVSGTDITKEYKVLAEKFGFSLREISGLIMNGVNASFLEAGEKAMMKLEFEERLSMMIG